MRQLLHLTIGLLACLAAASALPGLFPRHNITTYRYYADVKTGTIEPTPYASQFVISGLMRIKPELSDPKLKNAYYILLEVTHAIRNGQIQHFEKIIGSTYPIPDAAKAVNDPFMVVFDDNGKVKSLMVNKNETGWSRNMKKSIASMLQLDLASMNLATPMKPHGFLTKENTIYGECDVTYDVHQTLGLDDDHFTVTKIMEPMGCGNFIQYKFNSNGPGSHLVENEEEMSTASRRVFQIANMGEDLLIRTLVAHGVINYFPWKAKSEAHYILANQSMEFQSLMTMDNIPLPILNMEEMVTMDDVTYQKSETLYALNAGVDPTFGRHVVNLDLLRTKLMKMLAGAADYMVANHLEMTSPDMKHGQTMNRILQIMSQMDLPSLEYIFNNLLEERSPKEVTMTNLLLHMIPYVGTNATCLFTRNIIRKRKIADSTSINMLTKLPYNIRMPSDSLLIEMEDLMKFGEHISVEVRKAGILCFATMIYKTHEQDTYHHQTNMDLFHRYVQYYYHHMMNEPTYEMKMVYMQAMRNIEIGDVHKLLEPIIRGELKVSEKPEHLRFHAMMVNMGVVRDPEYIHNLYWPILANTEAPLEIRICAYEMMKSQPPRMDRMMNLYWLMVYEKNEHLYNYHYTFLKSMANTVDPTMAPMMEMARKILRFTRVRPVSGIMTGDWSVDYENEEFGFGESANLKMAADEHTGIPFIGMMELASLNYKRKSVNQVSLYLRVEGLDHIVKNMGWSATTEGKHILKEEMERVLKKASEAMPRQKSIHIEYSIMMQGRVVITKHLSQLLENSEMMAMMMMVANMKLNWQTIVFDELYTMQMPNDLGLPSLMYNNVPRVVSIKTNNEASFQTEPMLKMKLESVTKNWRHGYYSMEVYNPIIDTWHSIRRVSAYDTSIPIFMNMGYNHATKSVKMVLPIFSPTQNFMFGMRSYSQNYVMVMGAEKEMLQQYGGACNPTEIVTKGVLYRKNTTLINYDSKDTGLQLSMHRFDCERVVLAKSWREASFRLLGKENKNAWGNTAVLFLMKLNENSLLRMLDPELGTCGHLIKMEPSLIYPTAHIDINMRMNIEMPTSKPMSLFQASKTSLRGSLETTAAGTGVPTRTWRLNAHVDSNEGQTNNQLQIQINRTTPGQKDLKICIDGVKSFPTTDVDLLDHSPAINEEVVGKLTMTMAETDMGTCDDDGMSVIVTMKGEMSDEQKEELKFGKIKQMCQLDMDNPLFLYAESSIVPRTLACLREALIESTMRKYSYTVKYRNLTDDVMLMLHAVADDLRGSSVHDLRYISTHTEPGMMKMLAEYPLNDEDMNLILILPTHGEKYTGITSDHSHGWYPFLDNTRFSRTFMTNMKDNAMRFCTVYPEVLLNADGAVLPFNVPAAWTLLMGDYKNRMFSVFVKRLEPKKLGLLMSIGNRTIEVTPSVTIPTVSLDDNVIDYDNGFILSDGLPYPLRIIWNHNRLVMQSVHSEFALEWTGRSVTLIMNKGMQGQVTGLCGHLDGTSAERMSTVYTFGK